MEKRLINTEIKSEDLVYENNLRPGFLNEYIGQSKIKDNLKVYIEAANLEKSHWTMFYFMDLLDLERLPWLV